LTQPCPAEQQRLHAPASDVTERLTTRPTGLNGGPCFTEHVEPNGYVWWYIDALSDDGQFGLTIIAFVGSVFSPYYASARRRAGSSGATAGEHCAINVALYDKLGPASARAVRTHGHRWAMTERASRHVHIEANSFKVGPSSLSWDGRHLTIDLDEITLPMPASLRGRVVVTPRAIWTESYPLDAAGAHHWRPIAPIARVTVNMTDPLVHWEGTAYVDSNHGRSPLEGAFQRWDWSRAKPLASPKGSDVIAENTEATRVVYDILRVDGTTVTLAKEFHVGAENSPRTADFAAPPHQPLPTTGWGIRRATACDIGATCAVVKTVEDTPFYARSIISSVIGGTPMVGVHESLSLKRFSLRWVQFLLHFKMPRRR
jgi:carotenoid 1,2-hydratase